jgi:Flp pilus assembly protein TadD
MVNLGMLEEGAEHLRIVTERWPWYHGGHHTLGQALARMGREEEAAEVLERAEEARARSARIEHLQNTIRTMPDNPYHHAGLALELRRAGRYDDAMRSYMIARYLAPTDDAILNNIANLHLVSGDSLAAIRQYREILRLDPELPDIWLNLGIVYAISGQTDQARRAWEAALRLDPGHQAARLYLARLAQEED